MNNIRRICIFLKPILYYHTISYLGYRLVCIFISEGDAHASKRIRVLVDDSEEESDFEDDSFIIENDKSTLEALSGDVTFSAEESGVTVSKGDERWGLLDGRMLARVFHFLRSDLKSLVFVSMTCKHWKASVKFYKEVSRNVNLSSLGHFCTDSVLWNIVVGLVYIFHLTLSEIFHCFPI